MRDNYYADLEARFALEPALLADLREHQVLYDRVGTGELLHTYTPVLPGGFYLELLERRGGYDGYGSANTALRRALQAQHAATTRPARREHLREVPAPGQSGEEGRSTS